MTRKKSTNKSIKKKSEDKPVVKYPEFNLTVNDKEYDIATSLTVCSNSGSDKKKTLHHARKNRMERPILIELGCEVSTYNMKNFSLTIDEAKSVIDELQRMVNYLEEI